MPPVSLKLEANSLLCSGKHRWEDATRHVVYARSNRDATALLFDVTDDGARRDPANLFPSIQLKLEGGCLAVRSRAYYSCLS